LSHPVPKLSLNPLKKIIFTISFLVFTRPNERCKLVPETFASKKSKKGVYYNPYFTIDHSDSKGRLIFAIIISAQYNIA
jgi:hypothetical protein